MVPGDVDEDNNFSVRLVPRLGDEPNSVAKHPVVGLLEVVNAQEKPHPTRELVPDRLLLPVTVSLSEQQGGRRARRPDDNPSLRAPVVGQ